VGFQDPAVPGPILITGPDWSDCVAARGLGRVERDTLLDAWRNDNGHWVPDGRVERA
jgi:hypothetical protein